MGQNNQKDQKGPKMTAAVMLVQNNQNNQKIWSLHISHTILKVRFFWDTLQSWSSYFIFVINPSTTTFAFNDKYITKNMQHEQVPAEHSSKRNWPILTYEYMSSLRSQFCLPNWMSTKDKMSPLSFLHLRHKYFALSHFSYENLT